MKFIAPEVEVKRFNVVDVLTTSGAAGEDPIPSEPIASEPSVQGSYAEYLGNPCKNNASDNGLDDCA